MIGSSGAMRALVKAAMLVVLAAPAALCDSIEIIPRLRTFRGRAQATTLPNGKVLISGGNAGRSSTSKDAEIYDPTTRTFANIAPNIQTTRRDDHTATLLREGKVLIAGGDSSFPSTADLFDPVTETYEAVGEMVTKTFTSYVTARRIHASRSQPPAFVKSWSGSTATTAATDPCRPCTADPCARCAPVAHTFTPLACVCGDDEVQRQHLIEDRTDVIERVASLDLIECLA